jgi:4,5-DOPA dioxygenase extradiol
MDEFIADSQKPFRKNQYSLPNIAYQEQQQLSVQQVSDHLLIAAGVGDNAEVTSCIFLYGPDAGIQMNQTPQSRMPAIFFGHGSPMNVLEDNVYTRAWQQLGASMPKPKAILSVSAHWYTRGTGVTAMAAPKTIHDFGGFPQALYDMRYPAPGDPALAARVRDLLAPVEVHPDHSWGLDHGTWSVLVKAFPAADVPVVQLSIDATQAAAWHFEMGRRLAPLRDEGVLIIGSGDVVHNLRMRTRDSEPPYDWAQRFNDKVRQHLLKGEMEQLADYEQWGQDAQLAVPTAEHYLPLLYIAGTKHQDDTVSIVVDGINVGSVSMLTAVVG